MSEVEYPDCLRELYESEVFGETFARALMNVAKNDRDRYHFATLLQLETETKARLRPVLWKKGLSLEHNADLSLLEGTVEAYKSVDFATFAALIKPSVENFVSRFEAIAAAVPEDEKQLAQSMIRHEKSILTWLEQESTGGNDHSLDLMIAELE